MTTRPAPAADALEARIRGACLGWRDEARAELVRTLRARGHALFAAWIRETAERLEAGRGR